MSAAGRTVRVYERGRLYLRYRGCAARCAPQMTLDFQIVDQAGRAQLGSSQYHQRRALCQIASARWLQVVALADGDVVRLPAALG